MAFRTHDGTAEVLDKGRQMEAVTANDTNRANYAAYVADRRANGWTDEHVAEYAQEVGRIMKVGTVDERLAASEFWASKAAGNSSKGTMGINARIRASIAQERADMKVAA